MTDPASWGIDSGYHDVTGRWVEAPRSTTEAILASMHADEFPRPPTWDGVIVVDGGDRTLPPGAWRVELERGGAFDATGQLPPEVPYGYHRLLGAGDEARPLIVCPRRCFPAPTAWGWAAQIYAARSERSWGIGDLADLARLASWSAGLGAGVLMTNPLHAGSDPSPYAASSRCFRDPRYLDVAAVPGARITEAVVAEARALNERRLIDRDAVWALKSPVLEDAFERFGGAVEFDRYREEQGPALEGFTRYCALAELHGPDWRQWPVELRPPQGAGTSRFGAGAEARRRIRYHGWLQWLLDEQLSRAGSKGVGLVSDLAIGARAGGADSWMWQGALANEMRVGAPPDEFNTLGQDWALPPFDPWRLRAAGYEPFIRTVRSAFRHAGGLRFDHVMGLFRLYWIPPGARPDEGTYVRYAHEDLLAILALESHRARAFVVGEDLGTVEDLVRQEMSARDVLSYRVLWFEPGPPEEWPEKALAAVSTHDLPTVAGVWTGEDLRAQHAIGMAPNEAGMSAMRDELQKRTGAGDTAPVEEVIMGAHAVLASAACAVVTATLDDACAVVERPNMPGTTDEWPNWRLALPLTLDELERSELAGGIAGLLSRRGPPRA